MPNSGVDVRLRIEGHHLPGRRCGPYDEVHVALQVGRDPVDPVPADAASATWETDLTVVGPSGDRGPDVRGRAVQGRRGERFAYLTWGSTASGGFEMFRRAKLMLDELPALSAGEPGSVTARVHLTDDDGMPRCARLRAPAVEWSRG
jgi:Family of unknown function (DUF5990)